MYLNFVSSYFKSIESFLQVLKHHLSACSSTHPHSLKSLEGPGETGEAKHLQRSLGYVQKTNGVYIKWSSRSQITSTIRIKRGALTVSYIFTLTYVLARISVYFKYTANKINYTKLQILQVSNDVTAKYVGLLLRLNYAGDHSAVLGG